MIAIISDTHDNVENIKKAVGIMKGRGVEFCVHCGDVVAPATVRFFDGVKMKFIRGNCDGDTENIKKRAEEIGGEFLGEKAEFEHQGKRFCAYHGHDPAKLDLLIRSGKYDYVLTGHTHKARDEIIGKTRVINPGAHYYGAGETFSILDNGRLESIKIE